MYLEKPYTALQFLDNMTLARVKRILQSSVTMNLKLEKLSALLSYDKKELKKLYDQGESVFLKMIGM